jgi:transcriptional regulator with XRE-family HTH domain
VKTIGERLRLTREALGLSQADFARQASVSPSAYNQYEKGKMRPAIDQAVKIRDAHKLTLDWIYLGDNSGLRASLADAIKALRQTRG